jgi:hypothetical protein
MSRQLAVEFNDSARRLRPAEPLDDAAPARLPHLACHVRVSNQVVDRAGQIEGEPFRVRRLTIARAHWLEGNQSARDLVIDDLRHPRGVPEVVRGR